MYPHLWRFPYMLPVNAIAEPFNENIDKNAESQV